MNEKTLKKISNLRLIMEAISFVGIVALVVTFATTARAQVPPNPPGNSSGLVERFGMRAVLFALFVIGGSITGVFFLISRFPRLHKYPVGINAGNVEVQYHLAKLALCAAQLVTIYISCNLMISVYLQNIRLVSFGFVSLLIVAGVLYIVIFSAYIIMARRFK
jgi:hypothetical protein